MTAAEHLGAPDADVLRTRLIAVKWVQLKLADSAPECARELGVLSGTTTRPRALLASLCSPQAFDWLDTMVHLIDRNAPVLLPEGQFAGHAKAVVNLTAGLSETSTVPVRFDRSGVAELPALGIAVSAGAAAAGRITTVDVESPGPSVRISPLPTRPPSDAVRAPEHAAGNHSVPSAPRAVDHIVERWIADGGGPATPRNRRPQDAPAGALVALLEAAAIPTAITANHPGGRAIREDSSFDHLSLLSVREPTRFAALAAVAAEGADPLSRRITAHCSYIGRRYESAAEIYAELLLDDVEDLDLWRDYCWALRHSGSEELTRCWVMHPVEVVNVAKEVAFDRPQRPPPTRGTQSGASELVRNFLGWVGDDLG
ncbi:hypothetical protein MycrhDRAFT_5549 [Mycolicibacterium rhodesiae JS60]|nr:hypothetical protein MycrhDRAFT_5549 [Mycolicibacterium rhodesiae JS60]